MLGMSTFIQVQSSAVLLTDKYVRDYLKKNGLELQSIQTLKNNSAWKKGNAQQIKRTDFEYLILEFPKGTTLEKFENAIKLTANPVDSTTSLDNTQSYDLTKSIINIGNPWKPLSTDKAAPDKAAPDKAAPDKAAPDKAAPDKAAPDKAAPGPARPARPAVSAAAPAAAPATSAMGRSTVRVTPRRRPGFLPETRKSKPTTPAVVDQDPMLHRKFDPIYGNHVNPV
jgi:hypothetical protein